MCAMKMSRKLKTIRQKKLDFLTALKKLKPNHRCSVVNYLNDDGIETLCEIVHNVVHKDIKLSSSKKAKIRKEFGGHRKKLAYLGNKKNDIVEKRKILKQNGGFLGTLLTIAIPIIADLIIRNT
jgi:hypothetical protein